MHIKSAHESEEKSAFADMWPKETYSSAIDEFYDT